MMVGISLGPGGAPSVGPSQSAPETLSCSRPLWVSSWFPGRLVLHQLFCSSSAAPLDQGSPVTALFFLFAHNSSQQTDDQDEVSLMARLAPLLPAGSRSSCSIPVARGGMLIPLGPRGPVVQGARWSGGPGGPVVRGAQWSGGSEGPGGPRGPVVPGARWSQEPGGPRGPVVPGARWSQGPGGPRGSGAHRAPQTTGPLGAFWIL
ncbi:hypothetical protein NHX12_007799 [Muraenolepis orangiensis]|uniref:Uncharacterized protein n=1 Tax=Muraenolepis orangiensis TaxID=630683 RepID=A0A9Q0DQR2_9TELE|nr:hypothetical protein NHX12_007799 [Muraenolepis orangiensis]